MLDTKVNLFLIGASKCGTTYLHSLLAMHPEICMSSVKEPRIFQRDDYLKLLSQYDKYFEEYAGEMYLGESSPVYSETTVYPEVVSRIYKYNPEAKIIYIIRNPFERLQSVWIQAQSTGHEVEEKGYGKRMPVKFVDAVHTYPPFLEACRYWTHIEAYRKFFPDENIKVVLFEELVKSPEAVLRCVWEHLGLSQEFSFEIPVEKVNASDQKAAYNPWPQRIRSFVPTFLAVKIPTNVRRMIEQHVKKLTNPKMRSARISKDEISVIRNLLASEVEKTYKYLGRNDDPWGFYCRDSGLT